MTLLNILNQYKKIKKLILYFRWMQQNQLDVVTLITSPKGFGKSNAAMILSILYVLLFGLSCNQCKNEWMFTGNALKKTKSGELEVIDNIIQPCPKCKSQDVVMVTRFDFHKYLAYDNNEVRRLILDLPPFSPMIPDEGVRWVMGEDWMTYESKQMKKLFAQMRTKKLLVFICIPKFNWVDKKYKNDMTSFWIRIMRRGHALLMQPDLGEVDDPWHMKEMMKLMGSYNYFTHDSELEKRANKLMSKHPCVYDHFKIPKIPEEIYDEYIQVRDKKAFEDADDFEEVDKKHAAQMMLWNLKNNWLLVKEAMDLGKNGKITLKCLREGVLINPIDDEPLLHFTTIGKWIKDFDKVMKKNERKTPGKSEDSS